MQICFTVKIQPHTGRFFATDGGYSVIHNDGKLYSTYLRDKGWFKTARETIQTIKKFYPKAKIIKKYPK